MAHITEPSTLHKKPSNDKTYVRIDKWQKTWPYHDDRVLFVSVYSSD